MVLPKTTQHGSTCSFYSEKEHINVLRVLTMVQSNIICVPAVAQIRNVELPSIQTWYQTLA
jgi:hypothetical protein